MYFESIVECLVLRMTILTLKWLFCFPGLFQSSRLVAGRCWLLRPGQAAGTFGEQAPHPQVAGGQPDDGGLVQLRGDGGRQRQHLGQLIELPVLLLPPGPGGVLGLLLHPVASSLGRSRRRRRLRAARCHGPRCFQVDRPGSFLVAAASELIQQVLLVLPRLVHRW